MFPWSARVSEGRSVTQFTSPPLPTCRHCLPSQAHPVLRSVHDTGALCCLQLRKARSRHWGEGRMRRRWNGRREERWKRVKQMRSWGRGWGRDDLKKKDICTLMRPKFGGREGEGGKGWWFTSLTVLLAPPQFLRLGDGINCLPLPQWLTT